MSICAHRTETPGFFTTCNAITRRGCVCGAEVKSEQEGAA